LQTAVSVFLDEHIPKDRWLHNTQDDLTQKVSSTDCLQSRSLEIPEKLRSTTIDENGGDAKAHTSLHRRQTIMARYYLVDTSWRISLGADGLNEQVAILRGLQDVLSGQDASVIIGE